MSKEVIFDHFNDQHSQRDMAVTSYVDVYPSELTEQLADLMSEELLRLASNEVIRKEAQEIGNDKLLKYFKTLFYLRVSRVRHTLRDKLSSYQSIYDKVWIPSILQLVLVGIGEVRDEDYNIVFKPSLNVIEDDILPVNEMIHISEFLHRFQTLSIVQGLPKADDGELEFMVMRKVQDVVKTYKPGVHPVYAFLSAFCEMKEVKSLVIGLSRIAYMNTQEYKIQNRLLWNNSKQ